MTAPTSRLIALAIVLAAPSPAIGQLRNGGFEDATSDAAPRGWFLPPVAVDGGWEARIVETAVEGSRATRLRRIDGGTGAFGNLMQSVPAEAYRGKRVRLEAPVQLVPHATGDRLQMWLRVDRPDGRPGSFDNMADRPVTDGGAWEPISIVADVDPDAAQIAIGFMVLGSGGAEALIDDVRLTVLGDAGAGNVVGAPLGDDRLANVVAFVRLLGATRYFHPSDQAVAASWSNFAIHGIDVVEDAGSSDELARRLGALFEPVAPTVQVWAGDVADAPDRVPLGPDDAALVGIRHTGLGPDLRGSRDRNIYSSQLVREATPEELPSPPYETVMSLGAGVAARIPHVLRADARGTLPHRADPAPIRPDRPDGWPATADDRSVRLAAVAEAWSIWQHFYPYWDVVDVDWPGELETALSAAAVARNGAELQDVLARLVAAADDGHGNLFGGAGTASPGVLPFTAEWIDDALVVLHVADGVGGVRPGDTLRSIDGTGVGDLYDELGAEISASTEGWRRAKSVSQIFGWGSGPTATLELQSPDGASRSVRVRRIDAQRWSAIDASKPALAEEIAPGIRYVDLDRLQWTDVQPHLEALAAADGLVIDLRGYPGSAGKQILHHLTDELIHSAYWRTPRYMKPGHADVAYRESRWDVDPQPPRLPANVAFITDGRAISYAESCLAIVEAYGLGEIVGATTAGTNGNVNRRLVLGGYTMIWTGMRVVKHDGETVHQGVGVAPTVPCVRTVAGIAAGRDELLEQAIEVVRARTSGP